MALIQESVISGVVGLIVGGIMTVLVAQAIMPPWNLVGALIAVGVASFSSGFFGRYYAN